MAKEAKEVLGEVILTNGLIDVEASVAKYRAALSTMVSQETDQVGRIQASVNAAFDRYPNRNIEIDVLAAFVMDDLQIDPFEQKAFAKQVKQFVRNNADYQVCKGFGGGVKRVIFP